MALTKRAPTLPPVAAQIQAAFAMGSAASARPSFINWSAVSASKSQAQTNS
jgi:hypothetical protein